MTDQHNSPCSGLVDVQKDIKGHERELGGIDAKLENILKGQDILFAKTKELCEIATRNEENISTLTERQGELSDKIQNGLKGEIAKAVVSETKKSIDPEVIARFQELDKVMWLPRMIDSTVKKWAVAGLAIAIIGGIVLIIAYSSASMWGYFKETKWKETPGLMQNIEKGLGTAIDDKTHFHIMDGNVVIHQNTHMDSGAGSPKRVDLKKEKGE